MAALRTFLARTVGQHSSNNNNNNNGSNSTGVLAGDRARLDRPSATIEPANDHETTRANDGYSSTSTLGLSTGTNDDSMRHPLLHTHPTNRRRRFLLRLMPKSTPMNSQDPQVDDENSSLLERKLPRELILRIFSFLDYKSLCRCAQVSKYWSTLALDGFNWQSINLKSFQRDIDGSVLESLSLRCGTFLKRLNIENCKFISDHNMRILANRCPNLERIIVKHCTKLSNSTMFYLSKYCPHLNYINISSCHHIDDQGIKMISSSCPQLEWCDISWCMSITENAIRILAAACPKLTVFKAEGCTHMTNQAAIGLGKNCPKLTYLDFNRCSSLTDEGLRALAQSCPLLETLIIANCTGLTDNTLIALGTYSSRLKKLDATLCSQFTDVGFLALAQGCPSLQRIDLEDCTAVTDETLRHLIDHCPSIQILTLSRCEQISDEGVRQLGSSVNAQETLRILELDNCPSITDASIEHLFALQNLQRLDIFDCQQITKAAVKKIQIRCPDLKIHAYFASRTPTPPLGPTTSCALCCSCRSFSACVPSCCSIV